MGIPLGRARNPKVKHASRTPAAQTLLITERDLGGQGWGGPGFAVVNMPAMERKSQGGGDPIDVVVHEWIHSICGVQINGRSVPFADDAEDKGFRGDRGPGRRRPLGPLRRAPIKGSERGAPDIVRSVMRELVADFVDGRTDHRGEAGKAVV